MGVQALGLGLGTLLHEMGVEPETGDGSRFPFLFGLDQICAGHRPHGGRRQGARYRPGAVADGLFRAIRAGLPAVAMVTASHNDNGWTGVKMGAQRPSPSAPTKWAGCCDIVLGGRFRYATAAPIALSRIFRKFI